MFVFFYNSKVVRKKVFSVIQFALNICNIFNQPLKKFRFCVRLADELPFSLLKADTLTRVTVQKWLKIIYKQTCQTASSCGKWNRTTQYLNQENSRVSPFFTNDHRTRFARRQTVQRLKLNDRSMLRAHTCTFTEASALLLDQHRLCVCVCVCASHTHTHTHTHNYNLSTSSVSIQY